MPIARAGCSHRTDRSVVQLVSETIVILWRKCAIEMNYPWILRLAFLLGALPVSAQIFSPINRTYAYKQRTDLLRRLSAAEPDSNKVLLLLDVSNAYLKSNTPDSALFFSGQAVRLSEVLGMREEEQQAQFLACRAYAMKNDIAGAERVTAAARGIWKMRMLQEISEHYSFRPGNLPANLDTAWRYIKQVVALTDTMHMLAATLNTRAVLGKYYYERGELRKGIESFQENIQDAQLIGDKQLEAHWWSELGTYTPAYAATIDIVLQATLKARELFIEAGNPNEATYTLSDLSEWHWLAGNPQLAEQEETQVTKELRRIGQTRLFIHYRKLSTYELYMGNHDLALQLILMAKKNLDSLQEDYEAGKIDKTLANIYWAEDDIDKSLYWYRAVLQESQGRRDLLIYSPALRIVQGMIRQGDLTGAQQFLTGFQRDNPPVRSRDKELMATAWGNLFEALGQDAKAERSYLAMIRYNNLAKDESKRDIEQFLDFDVTRATSHFAMGKFYVDRNQFTKARSYLLMALAPQTLMPMPVDILRDAHLLLFKVDSAAGELASAIRHRLLYERYADSISTSAKTQDIAKLQIQYETEKKDRDISLLSKQALLQQADLSRSVMIRNIILGGLLLTLVISVLLFNQYQLKRKTNRTLRQLVSEKEILLREVHHRVKNNLQTIVSLLSSQSAFLTSDALQAIQDSQNRVFSISLIHQKLYQSENVAFIEMSSYLPELVSYLRDIYGIGNQISFHLDIAHVEISISQAVSIGLILNEALTNAIKHAFPEKNKSNTVVIEMVVGDRSIVHMKIADNGIGLPPDWNRERLNSLGIKLMKGLTDDLGGMFSIESQNGTMVYIRFVANAPFESAIKILESNASTIHV